MKHYLVKCLLLIIGIFSPQRLAYRLYKTVTGKNLNLNNPTDINEKVNWISFNTNTSVWSKLADKYEVRQYVIQKGYGDHLPRNYMICRNPFKINKKSIPSKCVIKTTNGSSTVIVVHDKNKISNIDVWTKLIHWFFIPFGLLTAEPHYRRIKCRFLVEELLEEQSDSCKPLTDYKFYCFNGRVEGCLVCSNRTKEHADKVFYDKNWNLRMDWLSSPSEYIDYTPIEKPKSYNQMIEMCQSLGSQFPFVRIDFYDIKGKAYFGEMTFTPAGGRSTFFNDEALKAFGDKLDLRKYKSKQ